MARWDNVTVEDRFLQKTYFCPITGCWIWMGATVPSGYGYLWVDGKIVRVHRWTWEQKNGPAPAGLVLDHFACNNPRCCNPDHVRLATHRENSLRGNGAASLNLAKQCCPKCGGPYSIKSASKQNRYCKPCARAAKTKSREKELATYGT